MALWVEFFIGVDPRQAGFVPDGIEDKHPVGGSLWAVEADLMWRDFMCPEIVMDPFPRVHTLEQSFRDPPYHHMEPAFAAEPLSR